MHDQNDLLIVKMYRNGNSIDAIANTLKGNYKIYDHIKLSYKEVRSEVEKVITNYLIRVNKKAT